MSCDVQFDEWTVVEKEGLVLYDLSVSVKDTVESPGQPADVVFANSLSLKQFDRVYVLYEYSQREDPSVVLWYYGYVISIEEAKFPSAPFRGIFPAAYVRVLDVETDYCCGKDELQFLSHVSEYSEVWPGLIKNYLLECENVEESVNGINKVLKSIDDEMRELRKQNIEGVYEISMETRIHDIALKVDALNRLLGLKDIVARDKYGIPLNAATLTSTALFHEKLTQQRVHLNRLNSPEVIAAQKTGCRFKNIDSCCLLLKFAKLSRLGGNDNLYARISLSLNLNSASKKTVQYEPFMMKLPDLNEPYDIETTSLPEEQYSCLFKNIPLDASPSGQDYVGVVVDILEFDCGSYYVIRSSSSELTPFDSLLGNGGLIQQQQSSEFDYNTVLMPKVNVAKDHKGTLRRPSVVTPDSLPMPGTNASFKCQILPGTFEKALKSVALPTYPSDGRPGFVISSPISDCFPVKMGPVVNTVSLRFAKMILEKKESEKDKFRQMKVSLHTTAEYTTVQNCISLGVGNCPKLSEYVSSPFAMGKEVELSLESNDVLIFHLGECDLSQTFIRIKVQLKYAKGASADFSTTGGVFYGEYVLPLTLMDFNYLISSGTKILRCQEITNIPLYHRLGADCFYTPPDNPISKPKGIKAIGINLPGSKSAKDSGGKPHDERLEVEFVVKSSMLTDSEKVFALFTQRHQGDSKFYAELEKIEMNPSLLRVLPYVVLKTISNIEADKNIVNPAMQFLMNCLLKVPLAAREHLDKYLADEKGFLLLISGTEFWKIVLPWMSRELGTIVSKRIDSMLPVGTPDLERPPSTMSKSSFYGTGPARVVDEAGMETVHFLERSVILFAWVKRSFLIDCSLNGFDAKTELQKDVCDMIEIIAGLLVKRHGDHFQSLHFLLLAILEYFPQFCTEVMAALNNVGRFKQQLSYFSACLDLKCFATSSVRGVLTRHIKPALCHTVRAESAVQRYYNYFSELLLKIPSKYSLLLSEDPSFQFTSSDSDFLISVFENIEFWIKHAPAFVSGESSRVFVEKIICAGIECVDLFSKVSAMLDSEEIYRIIRHLLNLCIVLLQQSSSVIAEEFCFLQLKVACVVFTFVYHDSPMSPHNLLLTVDDKMEEQQVSVFELLLQVLHLLVSNSSVKLENFSLPKQRQVKKWMDSVIARVISIEGDEDYDNGEYEDLRRKVALFLKQLHTKLIMPIMKKDQIFHNLYPVNLMIPMCLSSKSFCTRSDFIDMFADIYCLSCMPEKSTNYTLYSQLVREVDTCMGFKHQLGDGDFVQLFQRRLREKIAACGWMSEEERGKMEFVANTQMKDLLRIRLSSSSGLDPDLLILYTSDLVRFYARVKNHENSDISENLLYIRYQWHLYTMNMEHGNAVYAAETLMEFVLLLERLDHCRIATRPNKLDFMSDETPDKFFHPGMTTVDLSIKLLTEAASIYEKEKLFEVADFARDVLNSQLLRNLDYSGVAENNISRANLAFKITGTSLEEQLKDRFAKTDPERKPKTSKVEEESSARKPVMVNTRSLTQSFFFVHFASREFGKEFPSVLAGKSFVYRAKRDVVLSKFSEYLRSLFPDADIKEETPDDYLLEGIGYNHDKAPDILYAPLDPLVLLPKRFKSQLFVTPGSEDLEMFQVYGMTSFEKRIHVDCMHGLQGLAYSENTAKLLLPGSEQTIPKLIKERQGDLFNIATKGAFETVYDVSEENLICFSEQAKSPGKCRWQQICENPRKRRREVFSCVDQAKYVQKFLQILCGIYRKFEQVPENQVKEKVVILNQISKQLVSITSPIKGGLKLPYLAFCDPTFRERIPHQQSQIDEFMRPFSHLRNVLRQLADLCRKLYDENKENDIARNPTTNMISVEFVTLDNIWHTVEQDMSWSFASEEVQLPPEQLMKNAFEFVEQHIHLPRIMKKDPCIHESTRDFVGNQDGRASISSATRTPHVSLRPGRLSRIIPPTNEFTAGTLPTNESIPNEFTELPTAHHLPTASNRVAPPTVSPKPKVPVRKPSTGS